MFIFYLLSCSHATLLSYMWKIASSKEFQILGIGKIREKDKTGVYYIHFFILQKRLEAIAHLFFCQNAKRKLNVMAGSLINNNESFGIICNVTLCTIAVKCLKFKLPHLIYVKLIYLYIMLFLISIQGWNQIIPDMM